MTELPKLTDNRSRVRHAEIKMLQDYLDKYRDEGDMKSIREVLKFGSQLLGITYQLVTEKIIEEMACDNCEVVLLHGDTLCPDCYHLYKCPGCGSTQGCECPKECDCSSCTLREVLPLS